MSDGSNQYEPPEKSSQLADLVALLKSVDEDLRNAVYAIINSFEILPEADMREDREILHRTGILAARRLEYTHHKLATLARIVSRDFSSQRTDRSAQSLTREAVLFAIAQDGRFAEVKRQPHFTGQDVIVSIDAKSVVEMLASAILSVSGRCGEGRVQLAMTHLERDGDAEITWLITVEGSAHNPHWGRVLNAASPPDLSEGEVAIHDRYWLALADVIDASVEVSDVPSGLQIRLVTSVVRQAWPPGKPPRKPWTDRPALLASKVPANFSPIRTHCIELSPTQDLTPLLEGVEPGLLVLHQPEEDELATRRNILLCQQVDIPVLLRASNLTHEQLTRYRPHVDAILLEPSEEATLAQYVVGLCASDRRSRRRLAELH